MCLDMFKTNNQQVCWLLSPWRAFWSAWVRRSLIMKCTLITKCFFYHEWFLNTKCSLIMNGLWTWSAFRSRMVFEHEVLFDQTWDRRSGALFDNFLQVSRRDSPTLWGLYLNDIPTDMYIHKNTHIQTQTHTHLAPGCSKTCWIAVWVRHPPSSSAPTLWRLGRLWHRTGHAAFAACFQCCPAQSTMHGVCKCMCVYVWVCLHACAFVRERL